MVYLDGFGIFGVLDVGVLHADLDDLSQGAHGRGVFVFTGEEGLLVEGLLEDLLGLEGGVGYEEDRVDELLVLDMDSFTLEFLFVAVDDG